MAQGLAKSMLGDLQVQAGSEGHSASTTASWDQYRLHNASNFIKRATRPLEMPEKR